jgi:hypothetical protein
MEYPGGADNPFIGVGTADERKPIAVPKSNLLLVQVGNNHSFHRRVL